MSGKRRGKLVYWTPETCIQAVEDFVQRVGCRPTCAEMNKANGLPANMTFQQSVGYGMSRYCRERGYLVPPRKNRKLKERIWNPESIVKATDQFFQKYGRYPKTEEYCLRCGLPSHNTFKVHFGITAGEYWKQRYPMPPKWTRESALEAVRRFTEQNARFPMVKEFSEKNGLPPQRILLRLTGTKGYTEFHKRYFPALQPQRWTGEQCIYAAERFVREHGHFPATNECTAANRLPHVKTFEKRVGKSITTYCKEAFPDIKCRGRFSWNRDKCILALDQYVAKHKRYPRVEDCHSGNGLPRWNSFQKHTGQSPRDYCKERYPDICRRDAGEISRRTWDRESCIAAVSQYIHQHGQYPQYEDYRNTNGLPRSKTFRKMVGQPPVSYCKEHYSEACWSGTKTYWTAETCIRALEEYISTHGAYPTTAQWNRSKELPESQLFRRRVGLSLYQYGKEHYPYLCHACGRSKYWTGERCVQALERFISEHGEFPSHTSWKKENGLPTITKFSQRVGKAPGQYMREHYPDFCPSRGGRTSWDEKRLFEAVEQFAALHGRLPKPHEFVEKNHLPIFNTVKRITGTTPARFLRERYSTPQRIDAPAENQGVQMKGW